MSDGTLFDPPPVATDREEVEPNKSWPRPARARTTDPVESHEAAASVRGLTAKQEAVLAVLREATGPLHDQQLAVMYEYRRKAQGWPEQSPSGLRTRRAELVAAGQVVKAGRTKLASGRAAALWTVAGGQGRAA
jgi:hypothetical protein